MKKTATRMKIRMYLDKLENKASEIERVTSSLKEIICESEKDELKGTVDYKLCKLDKDFPETICETKRSKRRDTHESF